MSLLSGNRSLDDLPVQSCYSYSNVIAVPQRAGRSQELHGDFKSRDARTDPNFVANDLPGSADQEGTHKTIPKTPPYRS